MTDTNEIFNPWEVKGKVDYKKLIEKFGTEEIDTQLIERIEKLTNKPVHPWIKRGIFFSHRDLNKFLDAYEKGTPVFLYTGRGPSSESMHIGHMIPFMLTKYLQDVFNCPVVIQIADDEKYYFKGKHHTDFDKIYKLGMENAKDIIAFGFNKDKTFIFSNRDYKSVSLEYEKLASEFKFNTTFNDLKSIFGLKDNSNVGMIEWPIYQSIAAFSKSYPHIFKGKNAFCLTVCAIDQDPYFRLCRDVAPKMKLIKPCLIESTFISPLTGTNGKMSSSSSTESTIFLTDDDHIITKKIKRFAFSGGGGDGTLEEHKKYGGNMDTDIPCQYLKYFEFDDDKLNDIYKKFKAGEMTCNEIKKILIEKLIEVIQNHQKNRSLITDDLLNDFYSKKEIV
ncbi:MAG: putative Tryptophanyl-tRNA synthetase [Edafosvirus sp.]|uniref:tryptophan--tRNA ligase n=1 Tax=Edafosvirus sp. TaxID=2487765 RepID=A0A3G4ZSP4_9VIRU|nr:MAG: putative Tryptophanyl-tRNA synthetase [Edafosvirus sp.]